MHRAIYRKNKFVNKIIVNTTFNRTNLVPHVWTRTRVGVAFMQPSIYATHATHIYAPQRAVDIVVWGNRVELPHNVGLHKCGLHKLGLHKCNPYVAFVFVWWGLVWGWLGWALTTNH